jgi:hypothetical protein
MRKGGMRASVLLVALAVACGDDKAPAGDDTSDAGDDGDTDSGLPAPDGDPASIQLAGRCDQAADLGGFVVEATQDYSVVSGDVSDGVVPMSVLDQVTVSGDCRAMQRNNPYCDPACTAGETCDFDGECVPFPQTVDLGSVTIAGLVADVIMAPVSPGYTYFDTSLSHPAFAAGALIELKTGQGNTGAGALDPVTLHGVGVSPLELSGDTWLLVEGEPLDVRWTAADAGARSEIELRVNIDQHGSSPLSVYCTFADDGEGRVDAALVDLLVRAGVTGFPSGKLARITTDQASVEGGCMDFSVSSPRVPEVRVDGFTPCHRDEDCPDGQTCNPETEICE